MKRYFMNLFQEIREDIFPGKDNGEIIASLIAHAINGVIVASILYISVEKYLEFLNSLK